MDTIIISLTNDRTAVASGRFFAGDTCQVQIRGLPDGTDAAGLRFAILTPEKETAAQCFDFDATYTGEVSLTTNEIQAMLLNVPAGRNVEAAFRIWTEDGSVLASGFARLVSLPVQDPPQYVTMDVLEATLQGYVTFAQLEERNYATTSGVEMAVSSIAKDIIASIGQSVSTQNLSATMATFDDATGNFTSPNIFNMVLGGMVCAGNATIDNPQFVGNGQWDGIFSGATFKDCTYLGSSVYYGTVYASHLEVPHSGVFHIVDVRDFDELAPGTKVLVI